MSSFITSWIPTTSAAATRAADVATMPVGSWFNAAAGTYGCEFMLPTASSSTVRRIFHFSDGTGNNYEGYFLNSAAGVSGNTLVGGANQGRLDSGSETPGIPIKGAYSVNSSARLISCNGLAPTKSLSAARPSGLNVVAFGTDPSVSSFLNGYIRRVRYWPRAMSPAELQANTR